MRYPPTKQEPEIKKDEKGMVLFWNEAYCNRVASPGHRMPIIYDVVELVSSPFGQARQFILCEERRMQYVVVNKYK
jgi:hypothetical protein